MSIVRMSSIKVSFVIVVGLVAFNVVSMTKYINAATVGSCKDIGTINPNKDCVDKVYCVSTTGCETMPNSIHCPLPSPSTGTIECFVGKFPNRIKVGTCTGTSSISCHSCKRYCASGKSWETDNLFVNTCDTEMCATLLIKHDACM